jgi:hypothetical protein
MNVGATGLLGAGRTSRVVHRLPARSPGDEPVVSAPAGGGSDTHPSWYGAPAGLASEDGDGGLYTWHRADTYDKVIADNLKRNATLTAMLAYLAAEARHNPRDRHHAGGSERSQRDWRRA